MKWRDLRPSDGKFQVRKEKKRIKIRKEKMVCIEFPESVEWVWREI